MNLPNSITISRIATVPLLIWILSPAFPANPATHGLLGGRQELLASGVFILASITDGLDGYLARRRRQITTLGMLLDPLADKLMITAAYIVLVAYTPNIVPPWIAVIIIGREFLVSGLRSIAASEGFTIEASEIGKLKTVIQICLLYTSYPRANRRPIIQKCRGACRHRRRSPIHQPHRRRERHAQPQI